MLETWSERGGSKKTDEMVSGREFLIDKAELQG